VRRIAVMGTTCSGKSTLGRALAKRLDVPYLELDALFWGPGWTKAEKEDFRRRVEPFVHEEAWVVDGNYSSSLGDLVLLRADTVVWLDLSLARVLWRVSKRTLGRVVRRTELWSGNRETWRNAFLSRDSLFVWAVQTHGRFRRRLPDRLATDFPQVRLVRLRSPREIRRWLESPDVSNGSPRRLDRSVQTERGQSPRS
jgi:adenylate kinase family enzyme